MKVVLLTLNYPNKNGRIYTSELVRNRILTAAHTQSLLLCQPSEDCSVNLNNVCGLVKDMEIVGDELLGTVEFIPRKDNEDLVRDAAKGLSEGWVFVRPMGIASIVQRDGEGVGVVSDNYRLGAFYLTGDPA